MTKEQIESRIIELEEMEKSFQYIKDASFKTSEEFNAFQSENREQIETLKDIIREKTQLKLDSMSEEERTEYLRMKRQIQEKHSED